MTCIPIKSYALLCFKSLVMTQKKYMLVLLMWMVCFPGIINAQSTIPLKLKKGDWFKVRFQTKMRSQVLNLDNSYAISYHLTAQESTGLSIYKVTVDRTVIRQWLMTNPILGYDSYYPPYVQNQSALAPKAYFIVKTDKDDKIVQLNTVGKIPRAMLTEIKPTRISSNLTGELDAYGSSIINSVTTQILQRIRLGKPLFPHQTIYPHKGIVQKYTIGLTAASFKINSKIDIKDTADVSVTPSTLRAFDSGFQQLFIDHTTLSPEIIVKLQQQQDMQYKALIKKYGDRLSPELVTNYNIKKQYLQTKTKLLYLQAQKNLIYTIPKRQGSQQKPIALQDFPTNFFVSLDTLTLVIPAGESGRSVRQYLDAYIYYNRSKLPMTNWAQSSFIADYALSLACLKDYPLYNQLSAVLAAELAKGNWNSLTRIKPYYNDFMRNCTDSVLTQALKNRWRKLEMWAPGNPSPLKEIILKDGTELSLQQFKGKILCILFNYTQPSSLDSYLQLIKKQDPDGVHFVIGQLLTDQFKKGSDRSAAIFAKLPNVTYVTIGDQPQPDIAISRTLVKGIVLDKKQQVVIDNVSQLVGSEYVLNAFIQKANESNNLSDAEKSAIIKTVIWTFTSILLTALFVFFIQRSRMRTLKKNEQAQRKIKELEIKAIRSQMNPHFIFNALNSIQSLNNNGQYKDANSYLEKFSVLMRNILNNSEKSLIPLADELKTLTVYCELEQLRFDFNFVIEISETVDKDLIELPGMIIQPLVENAIIHGLAQKGTAGLLKVKITMEGIFLKVMVIDNGPGFKPDHTRPGGMGLKLVRERLELLQANGNGGELTIHSNFTGHATGTTVTLTIPID